MKILHVLSSPRAEGTPNLVLDWLATGLHEQEVFVLNSQPADLTVQLRATARWYAEANYFSRGRRKFTDISWGISKICRERRPDVLVCWHTGFANWVCVGARLAGVKRFLVYCGNPPRRGYQADWITRYVMWPLALLRARCMCCSGYVQSEFLAVPGISHDLFRVVLNCVRVEDVQRRAEEARAERKDPGCVNAIMVATLEPHKDHETLLRSLPTILQTVPKFRLRLVGDGSLRRRLEQFAVELGVSDNVEFLGMRRDVPELLGQSDLFVFSTTRQEGLGSVLIEALAAGLTVVASDVPACREVLRGGEFGRLVPGGDPAALAEMVIATIRKGPMVSAVARREYLETFLVHKMIRLYLSDV